MTRWIRSAGIVEGLVAAAAAVSASLIQVSSAGSQMATRCPAITLTNPAGIVTCQRARRVVAGAVALVVADVVGAFWATALAAMIPIAKSAVILCVITSKA